MNYSGCTNRKTDVECKEVKTKNQLDDLEINPEKESSGDKEDNLEVFRIVYTFEKMKKNDPDLFSEIMHINKEIIEICSKNKCSKDDLESLSEYFSDLEEIDDDFLFWCVHKSIRIAVIENKNLEVAHFMIVKKGYRLNNKVVHKNLLNDYIKSLSQVKFEDCENDKLSNCIAIFEFLIQNGKVDINEKQEGLQNTPLHFAVIYKQTHFILSLLRNKCDINTKNIYGDTPLDFALDCYQSENDEAYAGIVSLLMQYGAKANTQNHLFEDLNEIEIGN